MIRHDRRIRSTNGTCVARLPRRVWISFWIYSLAEFPAAERGREPQQTREAHRLNHDGRDHAGLFGGSPVELYTGGSRPATGQERRFQPAVRR